MDWDFPGEIQFKFSYVCNFEKTFPPQSKVHKHAVDSRWFTKTNSQIIDLINKQG